MALEKSVLSDDTIRLIMFREYNILIDTIKKKADCSANLFELLSPSGHFILKEFQSKVNYERIKLEYLVINHLRKDGIPVPQYVLNKKGDFFCEYNKRFLIVQYFIEGHVIPFHSSTKEQILESANMYGKIVSSLNDFSNEIPCFKRHLMSRDLVNNDIKEMDDLLQYNRDINITYALMNKKNILLKLMELDYSWQDNLTYKKSHGDFNVSQFIYNNDDKIEAVVDWVSLKEMPVVRELIRNYFFISRDYTELDFNIKVFIEYLKEFEKYYKLNMYDIKYMPLLYLIELSRTVFGYKQYIYQGAKQYLLLGNELYQQCVFLEKNSKEISLALLSEMRK